MKRWKLSAREHANLYVFIGVLLVVGAVFGVLLVHALTFEQQQDLAGRLGLFLQSMEEPSGISPAQAFRDNLLFYGKWLVLIWLFGLSVIGLPAVLMLNFLKGVLLGFTLGLLTQELAWSGVLVFFAAVAPQNVFVVPALAIASVSAIKFATFVVRERLIRRKGRLLPPFLAHTAIALLMLGILILAALLEAYLSPLLLHKAASLLADASGA